MLLEWFQEEVNWAQMQKSYETNRYIFVVVFISPGQQQSPSR